MTFDPDRSSIAITIPHFTLKKRGGGLFEGRYSEPYIVSVAIDELGEADPSLSFSFMPFPKVQAGQTVEMLGDGHLLYGPRHPGSFVALSVLVMESDGDIRRLGAEIDAIVNSNAALLGLKAIVAANPGAAGILAILKELVQFIAGVLQDDGDDELYRTEGTFLRDAPVPFHIGRRYQRGNEYIDMALEIIALDRPPAPDSVVKDLALA